MKLLEGFKALALKLQEASMMHSDVRSRLSDAVNDQNGSGNGYSYYIDHDGDGDSGNVVYSSNGDIRMCPYEIGTANGKSVTNLDMDNSKNVVPVTSYQEEADDHDHYTSMDEAFRRDGLYTDLPVYERFISKASRKAADSSSFAGKGRSFPILKPEDVSAALHSIGRAGPGNYSSDTLRSNIKRIAKSKGFGLPDSLKDENDKESAVVELTGDCISLREGAVGQDGTVLVKVIQPGWGSSGYYSPSVLERDLPKIYPAGTKMFWNHQTAAEESARPEGDLRDLASVTTEPVKYMENGPDGPGGYVKARAVEQFKQPIEDLAKHIGVSIRASGKAKEGQAPDGKRGPIIERLDHGNSIDYVTTPGAGGKIMQLFEAARGARKQGEDMDEATIQRLIEGAVTKAIKPLQEENQRLRETFALRTEAPQAIVECLRTIRLPGPLHVVEATQRRIIQRLAPSVPFKEGKIDRDALAAMVEAEAVDEARYLADLGYGQGVASIGKRLTEAEIADQVKLDSKSLDKRFEESMSELAEIFIGPKLDKGSVSESDRQARKRARKAFMEGRAA